MSALWAALRPLPLPDRASPIEARDLGVWALQFSPRVALLDEAVLVEVGASLRLFGGAASLRVRMAAEATQLGATLAWGDTGLAALARVRQWDRPGKDRGAADVALNALPLAVLTAAVRHQPTLERIGCRRLGQLRQLPRAGVVRRFGQGLLDALDQAYGTRPETYAWLALPAQFRARLELMARVEAAPALLWGAQRLLLQMAGWLAARRLGATAFTLHWLHDSQRARDCSDRDALTVRTAKPTQSVEHLGRLLAEHLAQVQLQAPVAELVLEASEVAAYTEQSRSLLPERVQKGPSLERALERIQLRLQARGAQGVCWPVLSADHRLEWMQHWQCAATPGRSVPPPVGRLPQPTWVLPQPLRLDVRGHRPCYPGPLQLLLGPDRIEGGWWHRCEDAAVPGGEQHQQVQRDYWLAHSPEAGLLWVFQRRLAHDQAAWFLHGFFA